MTSQTLTYTISQLNSLRSDSRITIHFDFCLEVNRWRNRRQFKYKNNNPGNQSRRHSKDKYFENRCIKTSFPSPILKIPNYLKLQNYPSYNEEGTFGFEHVLIRNNYQHKSQAGVFQKPKYDQDIISFQNLNWKSNNQVKYRRNELMLNSGKHNTKKKDRVKVSEQYFLQSKDIKYGTSSNEKNKYSLSSNPNNPFSVYGFYPSNLIIPEITKDCSMLDVDSDNLSSSFDNFTIVIH